MDQLVPLFLFAAVATVTPGGATTLVTASGAHFGFRRSLPLLLGIAAGLASMAAAAALGLAAMLLALPLLQHGMKIAGTLYLSWLAWRIAGNGPPHLSKAIARPTSFIGGVWMLWHNPKGWAMTSGAAVSFATLAESPARLAVLLGAVFGLAALCSLVIWCIAGQTLARIFRAAWQWRTLNVLLAILLVLSIFPMWFP